MDSRRTGHAAFLTVASLGVVFGDIGTSPLYALRECFAGSHAIAVMPRGGRPTSGADHALTRRRQAEGGSPTSFLKARLKAASDP